MRKLSGILIIAMVLFIGGLVLYCSGQNKPEDKQKDVLFRIGVSSKCQNLFRETASNVFSILEHKYGTQQEKFTVRLIDQNELFIDRLLERIKKKEIDVFMGPLVVPGITENALSVLDKNGFHYKKIGDTPVGVVVSKSVAGLSGLSSAEFKDILTGKIDDWSKIVKGKEGKIVLYGAPKISLQQWLNLPDADIKANEGLTEDILKLVAEERNSLAVIPLMGLSDEDKKKVSILSIDNADPSNPAVKYPYSAPVYLAWNVAIEKHKFVEELLKQMSERKTLAKFNIKPKNVIIVVPPTLESLLVSIISETNKTLNGKYQLPEQETIIKYSGRGLSQEMDVFIGTFVDTPEDFLSDKDGYNWNQIGTIPVGVIMSKSVSGVTNISSETLKAILTGKINDWSELSPELKGKITVYTSRKEKMIESILKVTGEIKATESLLKEVYSRVAEDKNSMGIIPLMGLTKELRDKINVLSIDNVSPTEETVVETKEYPYQMPFYIVWKNGLESNKFFEEFVPKWKDKELLLKYNVYKVDEMVLGVSRILVEPIKEIVSKIFKALEMKDSKWRGPVKVTSSCDMMSLGEVWGLMEQGKVDMHIGSLDYTEEKKGQLESKGICSRKIGVAPLGVIVSVTNTGVTDLTSALLADILKGKIDAWSKINPSLSGKINIYYSSRLKGMIQEGLRIPGEIKNPVEDGLGQREVLSGVTHDENGLGIIPLIGRNESNLKNVIVLSINNLLPVEKSIKDGKYPVIPYYLFWNKNGESGKFGKFIEAFNKIFDDKESLQKYNIWN
jgi:ABC-type phosphate transport system substrate-binding protein